MPQPIDMQTELARTTLANRVQDAANRSAMAAAMRARIEDEEEQPILETQVDETPESQSEHVDTEAKRRNPFIGRRPKRSDSEGNGPSEKRRADESDHAFDVTV